uniref:Abhydrolase domain containing 15 n=1 Tax=Apteryx owenii TaxID=8824 RepID=A0A8B9Q9W2_APTOW
MPLWALALGALLGLLAALWGGRRKAPRGPRLLCRPSALALHLERRCPALQRAPAGWAALPALQTLLGVAGPAPGGLRFLRTHLQMSDGGLVALDWAAGPAPAKPGRQPPPVLLLVPNSFGKVTRNLSQLCHLALLHGYCPVVFNRRGHNGCPLSTPKLQPYGDPADLQEAIRYLRCRCPGAQLFAAAESTGAGLLLSHLGECGSSSQLAAAGCISPIFSPRKWFEGGCPWHWQQPLLLYQKAWLSRFATALGEVLPLESFFGGRSLRELEEALFCQAQGWDAYWESNDPLRDVDEVAVPVLCICSQDDPVCRGLGDGPPRELFETNPYLFLALARHGGHCGFLQHGLRGSCWSHELLLEFFQAAADFLGNEGKAKGAGAPAARATGAGEARGDVHGWRRSYTR